MIVVDTNVVSEMMRPEPVSTVVDWFNAQETPDLFLATVAIAEITYGVESLPEDNRRRRLQARIERVLERGFSGRILPFDLPAALLYGRIMAARRRSGRPLSVTDGQIASIALHHGFSVATRNVRDFSDMGLRLINPFPE